MILFNILYVKSPLGPLLNRIIFRSDSTRNNFTMGFAWVQAPYATFRTEASDPVANACACNNTLDNNA